MQHEEHTRDQLTQKDHKWTTMPAEQGSAGIISTWAYTPLTGDLVQLWISPR